MLAKDVYVRDVFTPSLPARLTFVERGEVDDKLVRALQTPGKQVVVFGHTGAGKTTLLCNKLEQVFDSHVTTRCIKGMSFEQIILNAFDQLGSYYERDVQRERSRTVNAALKYEYLAVKAEIGASTSNKTTSTSTRLLPPQLTPQLLANLMGEAKACWVIEDFHKIEEEEKTKVAQTMKVFMDAAASYPDVKIVAVGAVGTGREVVRLDREMAGRVSEVSVPLMADDELRHIVLSGARLLKLRFDHAVVEQIVSLSSGLPAICHQICLNICFSLQLMKASERQIDVGKSELDAAVRMYVEDVSDTLKERFDKATRVKRQGKFDNGRILLKALCAFGADGATYNSLYQAVRKAHDDYPPSNMTTYLRELQLPDRGEVISLDQASGKFYFSDPFIRALSQANLGVKPKEKTWNEILELLLPKEGSVEHELGSSWLFRDPTS